MVKDAERFAETDKKKKEEVETRNQADNLVYSTEKSLKDFGDKVGSQDKEDIEKKSAALKEAIKGGDIDVIKKAMEELTQASHKLAEAVYKAQAAQQQQSAGSQGQPQQPDKPNAKNDEDVVDAEYKVEGDDTKK